MRRMMIAVFLLAASACGDSTGPETSIRIINRGSATITLLEIRFCGISGNVPNSVQGKPIADDESRTIKVAPGCYDIDAWTPISGGRWTNVQVSDGERETLTFR